MAIQSRNPANNEILKAYPEIPPAEIATIIEKAHQAHLAWKKQPLSNRLEPLQKLIQNTLALKKEYAAIITKEMGKPINQAIAELEKCTRLCDYYIQESARILADKPIPTEAQESFVTYQPLGVILNIMPWNFPFWQVYRAAIPSIIAGNAVILKHAPCVPECALTIEALFHQSGIPVDLFRTILVEDKNAAFATVHPLIRGISLTGSTRAGEIVAAQAGTLLKKTVLELGGNDPYIILEDADLEKAASSAVDSRMINSGQSCISAKRAIVVESQKEAFENLVLEKLKKVKMGDPRKADTQVGPLARMDLRDNLHKQVQATINEGATLKLGGTIPEQEGAWYPPTLLSNVSQGMTAYNEELFGPVISIISVKNETEAIRVANDSEYGLGAAIFTQNIEKAKRIAREEIETGSCAINSFIRSDPRLPFGGIKKSGYGREMSDEGLLEFVNQKTVIIP